MSTLELVIGVAGGVALLLWATRMVRTGVERAYQARLRVLLAGAAQSRLRAFLSGLLAASVLQSSTATALLTASFARNGALALAPALVIMLGADLGSTVAAQVLSFDLGWAHSLLIFTGVALFLSSSDRTKRQMGRIFVGLGLMLLSLRMLREAMTPLFATTPSAELISVLEAAPLVAVVGTALLTWAAHSSLAIVLIVASLAQVGILSPSIAFAAVIGANIGSGIIAVALTKRDVPAARAVTLGNFLMRVTAGLAAVALLPVLIERADWFGSDATRQTVNFHTAFNIAAVLVFAPLDTYIARIAAWLAAQGELPERVEVLLPGSSLDPAALGNPALAATFARREALRLADQAEAVLEQAISLFETGDKDIIRDLTRIDDEIDARNTAIKLYLSEARRIETPLEAQNTIDDVIRFSAAMEHIGDIVTQNLARLARKRIATGANFSEAGWQELTLLHQQALSAMRLAVSAFTVDSDTLRADAAEEAEAIAEMGRDSVHNHLSRLTDRESKSHESSTLHIDAVRDLTHIGALIAEAISLRARTGEIQPVGMSVVARA